jgi:hypothetical protein
MPAEPCCEGAMAERAVGGITYRPLGGGLWRVILDAHPMDITVQLMPPGGDVKWLVCSYEFDPETFSIVTEVRAYETLEPFERSLIFAQAIVDREMGGGEPPADTGGTPTGT